MSDEYGCFGSVKGAAPTPWGKVRGTPIYPWYFTSLTIFAFVFALFVGALMWSTTSEGSPERRWMSAIGLLAVPVFWFDLIATTVIVRRSRRREKRA